MVQATTHVGVNDGALAHGRRVVQEPGAHCLQHGRGGQSTCTAAHPRSTRHASGRELSPRGAGAVSTTAPHSPFPQDVASEHRTPAADTTRTHRHNNGGTQQHTKAHWRCPPPTHTHEIGAASTARRTPCRHPSASITVPRCGYGARREGREGWARETHVGPPRPLPPPDREHTHLAQPAR
jgi:hypothetical protein